MAEQTATRTVGRQRDAAHPRAADVGNAVVPRQTLVDEREVGVEEIDDAAVLLR